MGAKIVLDRLDPKARAELAEAFLAAYFEPAFGSMSKREVERSELSNWDDDTFTRSSIAGRASRPMEADGSAVSISRGCTRS